MKKVVNTKQHLFENMAKINSDFKLNQELLKEGDEKWIQKAVDPEHKGYCTPMTKPTCTPKRKALAKRFKKGIENEAYGTPDPLGSHCAKPMNEISTGLAQQAADKAYNSFPDDITTAKKWQQGTEFVQYINPNLKKYLYSQFANVPDFKAEGAHKGIRLTFPTPDSENTKSVSIFISANEYILKKISIGEYDPYGTGNKQKREYEEEARTSDLPPQILHKLPLVIKRIQADLRGEKSIYNPAKPEPAPTPEPTPEPAQSVQQAAEPVAPQKPTGVFGKLKSKFGIKEGE